MLVLAGDHIYKMDYGPMIAYHVEKGADITVGVVEVPAARAREFGVLSVTEWNRVTQLHREAEGARHDSRRGPKWRWPRWASTSSTPACSRSCWSPMPPTSKSAHDFGKNIIPAAIDVLHVVAYPFTDVKTRAQNYWRDVGTIDAFYDANIELVARGA